MQRREAAGSGGSFESAGKLGWTSSDLEGGAEASGGAAGVEASGTDGEWQARAPSRGNAKRLRRCTRSPHPDPLPTGEGGLEQVPRGEEAAHVLVDRAVGDVGVGRLGLEREPVAGELGGAANLHVGQHL